MGERGHNKRILIQYLGLLLATLLNVLLHCMMKTYTTSIHIYGKATIDNLELAAIVLRLE